MQHVRLCAAMLRKTWGGGGDPPLLQLHYSPRFLTVLLILTQINSTYTRPLRVAVAVLYLDLLGTPHPAAAAV